MAAVFGFMSRIAVFACALAAAIFVSQRFVPGVAGIVLIGCVTLAGALLAIRHGERETDRAGALTPALRRYNRRMAAAGSIYVVTLLAATWLFNAWRPTGAAAWLTALVPAAGALAMILPIAQLLREESDEYIRARLVRQALWATGFLLVLATLWGFLEQFGLVPHVPAWAALPLFAIGNGLAMLLHRTRA